LTGQHEIADAALNEQFQVKAVLRKLDGMYPRSDQHKPTLELLAKYVDSGEPSVCVCNMHVVFLSCRVLNRHIETEETDVLPALLEKIPEEELENLAKKFAKLILTAPTHPHPDLPNKPPVNAWIRMCTTPTRCTALLILPRVAVHNHRSHGCILSGPLVLLFDRLRDNLRPKSREPYVLYIGPHRRYNRKEVILALAFLIVFLYLALAT
jgi:hypothetical protein